MTTRDYCFYGGAHPTQAMSFGDLEPKVDDSGIPCPPDGYDLAVQTSNSLPDSPLAPRQARLLVRQTLGQWDLSSLVADAEVIVSELVTNAVKHGAGPVTLTIGQHDQELVISVSDEAVDAEPAPRELTPDAFDGRGMHLVAALSQRWGWRNEDHVKTVWAELPISTQLRT